MALMLCSVSLIAQEWPQYLGPNRNGTSPQQNLLRSWPGSGPEVLWSVETGIGYGGPVVMDGKVYLLDRDNKVGDMLRCFDMTSGEELWSFDYDAPGEISFPGSRSVPTVDGNHVYSCGPYGDLYCIDINTHKPVWHKNIWKDYGGGQIPRWAITQCPLVYGNLLIVASQAPQAGVVAYDKMTGEVKWETPSLGAVGYVSPAIVKVSGEDHLVMITASSGGRGAPQSGGRVVGMDPLNGDILWDYTNWQCRIPVPSAMDAGNNKVLIIGGYEAGTAMIQVDKDASGSYQARELYKEPDFGAHTKPALLHEGYFYAMYTTNERRDGMVCMSMDGEIMWSTKREPSFVRGSMVLADGLILATDGAKNLYLIEPDPSGFKELASIELLGTGQNWAPIALADGRLLIKDQEKMLCLKVSE